MQIQNVVWKGRKGWKLDTGALSLVMLQGGGHIASVTLNEADAVNPMWQPVWKTREPWLYRPEDAKRYGVRLLSGVSGHLLCLGWFGDPSAAEAKQGLGSHGEAPVARWRKVKQQVSARRASLVCACDMPVSGMRLERTLSARANETVVHVRERLVNLNRRDVPYAMCEHVTFSPPFLEKGVTFFDMSATRGHTFPGAFSKKQRLKGDAAFTWPLAPGAKGGKVDLRTIGREYRHSSDFSTQLMNPASDDAWFAAVNPRLGLMMAYVWKRQDFPWLGNWEENYARTEKPWDGRSLTRGMEFTNAPFPVGLRKTMELGTLDGLPTYRWLPARGSVTMEFDLFLNRVDAGVKSVGNVRREDGRFSVSLQS